MAYRRLTSTNKPNLYRTQKSDPFSTSNRAKSAGKIKALKDFFQGSWTWSKNNIHIFEVVVVLTLAIFTYSTYYYLEHMHFHLLRTYAWAGYDEAQQLVAQRYVTGKGVEKNTSKAMEYFKMAADQGHPKASHNLALGHALKHVNLPPGEARRLLNHASVNGVEEADKVIEVYCNKRRVCGD